MSLARTLFFSATLGMAIGAWGCPGGLRADEGLGSEARQVEKRLEERVEQLAHTDPTHIPPDAEPLPFDQHAGRCGRPWCSCSCWRCCGSSPGGRSWPVWKSASIRSPTTSRTAKRQKSEADSLVAKYEARLAAAGDEVRAILEEARRSAEGVKQSILAEAKQGAEAERARSLHEIETATDAALRTLAERSAHLAVELAGKIVRHNLTAVDQARLVTDAIDQFAARPSKN